MQTNLPQQRVPVTTSRGQQDKQETKKVKWHCTSEASSSGRSVSRRRDHKRFPQCLCRLGSSLFRTLRATTTTAFSADPLLPVRAHLRMAIPSMLASSCAATTNNRGKVSHTSRSCLPSDYRSASTPVMGRYPIVSLARPRPTLGTRPPCLRHPGSRLD